MLKINKIHNLDCLSGLKQLPDESINCCVTSPPYYGLRDYGLAPLKWPEITYSILGFKVNIPEWTGDLGLEPDEKMFIGHLVYIFRETRRTMAKDGTLWLIIGDSYWGGKGKSGHGEYDSQKLRYKMNSLNNPESHVGGKNKTRPTDRSHPTIKPKDLIGIPWMLAFALRADGWFLRQDLIWNKSNPMPESVKDRCTKSHEYIFLLTKSKNITLIMNRSPFLWLNMRE